MSEQPSEASRPRVTWAGVLRGWCTASFAAVGVALAWAVSGGFVVAWEAQFGLIFAWAAGVVLAFGPGVEPVRVALGRFIAKLDSPRRRLKLLVSIPLLLLAWWVVGQLALRLLVAFEDRPPAGAVLLSTLVLGILSFANWLSDQVARRASGSLARLLPAPLLSAALAAGLLLVGAGALVGVGTTSGAGGPLALFGVFKRPELDLSIVFLTLAVAAVSLVLHGLAGRRLSSWGVSALLVLSVGLGAWGVGEAAKLGTKDVVAVERGGGVARSSLRMLQRLTDWDGDGYARAFGGGDCDDQRKSVHPGAVDLPDNGVDEDCSGSDRTRPSEVVPDEVEEAPPFELPNDLNVLLLTVDTLRADVGFNGPIVPGESVREGLTPQLDELAEQSTVFERAYALASYTSKSLGPMLIGKYPSETARSFEHFDRFPEEELFVQERLQSAGITTVAAHGYWYFFMKTYGFERGWDVLNSEAAPKYVSIEGDKSSNGAELATETIEELEKLANGDERFYLWTHWVDPHSEYVRHPDFDYGSSERERYDSEVSMVDAQIGRILAALKELDLFDETVILVTSDHGEAFGEHGMIRHGFEVWEELVRVPLLLYVPGADPGRVEARRSLIDTTATLLHVFGIEPFDGMAGTSLLRDVLGAAEPTARPVLVDMPAGPHNRERRAFYSGDMKLIVTAGRVIGLYDLAKDPREKRDLSNDEALVEPVYEEYQAFVDRLDVTPAR